MLDGSLVDGSRAAGPPERLRWASRWEYLLSLLGYAVGIGNIWRFPYKALAFGGGSFVFPYLLSLVFMGIPIFLLESALGQKMQKGLAHCFKEINPRFAGVGWAPVFVTGVVCLYYNTLLSWCLYFFVASFQNPLPWTPAVNSSLTGAEAANAYFQQTVLQQSSAFNNGAELNGPLTGSLFVAWVIIFICIWKGIRSSGKVAWVTCTLPFLVLMILFFRGVTLPGAGSGVAYYLTPDWPQLGNPKVWADAAAQLFFSLGIGWGTIVALASYNDPSDNLVKPALAIPLINSGTSIVGGFAVFSALGYFADQAGLSDLRQLPICGPGLIFVAYPAAISTMPASNLFAVLFFIMLISLAVDSQFAFVETIMTFIVDQGLRWKHWQLAAVLCFGGFLASLTFVTRAGALWVRCDGKGCRLIAST